MCLDLVEFVSFRIWFNVNDMIKEIIWYETLSGVSSH